MPIEVNPRNRLQKADSVLKTNFFIKKSLNIFLILFISFFLFFITFSPLTIYLLFKNNILAFNVLHNVYTDLLYYIKYWCISQLFIFTGIENSLFISACCKCLIRDCCLFKYQLYYLQPALTVFQNDKMSVISDQNKT